MRVKHDLFLYVPTYRRTQRPLTLQAIPREWRERTVIVCPPDEAVFYLKNFRGATITSVQEKLTPNIAAKRAWIFENTPHEKIMMLDDDLNFFVRANPKTLQLSKAEPWQMISVFEIMEAMLDQFAHGGISQRYMNQNFPEPWRYTCKVTHACAYRVSAVRKHCQLGRVKMFEDLDYTLQLFYAGLDNAVLNWAATNDPLGFNAPGGESEKRKVSDIDKGADIMAKLHPGIVRIVERTDAKADEQGHKRIVVAWAKALAQGRQNEFI